MVVDFKARQVQKELSFKPSVQQPPSNPEVEDELLGCLLFDGSRDLMAEISDRFVGSTDIFTVSKNQMLWDVLAKMHQSGHFVNLISVVDYIGRDELQKFGGRERLTYLIGLTITSSSAIAFADLLVTKWRRRKLLKYAHELAVLACDESGNLEEQMQQAQEDLYTICDTDGHDKSHELEGADKLVVKIFEDISEGKSQKELVTTGFYDYDCLMGGLEPGSLNILAARPAMGKSSAAMQIAYNISKEKLACVFSLEMTKTQLMRRLVSQVAGIESSYLKSSKLSDNQWFLLSRGMAEIQDVRLYISDKPGITINEIRNQIRKQSVRCGEKPGIIVIDYLQLLANTGDEDFNMVAKVTKISGQLKQLAMEFNCPVLALSQLSRKLEERNNKRPQPSDLRESGALEQDANTITFIYRDEVYNNESPERGVAELIVAKNRDGANGVVKMLFDGNFTQFKNLARSGPGTF
jgi:replicative DNA helicase